MKWGSTPQAKKGDKAVGDGWCSVGFLKPGLEGVDQGVPFVSAYRMWALEDMESGFIGSFATGAQRESHCFHLAIVVPTAECPEANLDTHIRYVGGCGDKAALRRGQSTRVAKWSVRRLLQIQ